MKNTLIVTVLVVLFLSMFSEKVLALTIPNINIPTIGTAVPVTSTPVPTLVKIKFDPNIIKVVGTATPTPITVVVTQVVTQVVTPTGGERKVIETEELNPTITQATDMETVAEATVEGIKDEGMAENKIDLKTWFMGITIGLLALIIIIQLFPKKKED